MEGEDDSGVKRRKGEGKAELVRLENNNNEIVGVNLNCLHSHSHLGIVSGSLGIGGDGSMESVTLFVVANRFPAWLWNVGGCVGGVLVCC